MWLLCNRNHENMKNDPVKRRNTFHCRVIFIPFEPGRVFLGRQAPDGAKGRLGGAGSGEPPVAHAIGQAAHKIPQKTTGSHSSFFSYSS